MRLAMLILVVGGLGLASGCGVDEYDLVGASCTPGAQQACGTVLVCDLATKRCKEDPGGTSGGGSGGGGSGGGGGGGGASP